MQLGKVQRLVIPPPDTKQHCPHIFAQQWTTVNYTVQPLLGTASKSTKQVHIALYEAQANTHILTCLVRMHLHRVIFVVTAYNG